MEQEDHENEQSHYLIPTFSIQAWIHIKNHNNTTFSINILIFFSVLSSPLINDIEPTEEFNSIDRTPLVSLLKVVFPLARHAAMRAFSVAPTDFFLNLI